jgi:hypothetical protein
VESEVPASEIAGYVDIGRQCRLSSGMGEREWKFLVVSTPLELTMAALRWWYAMFSFADVHARPLFGT